MKNIHVLSLAENVRKMEVYLETRILITLAERNIKRHHIQKEEEDGMVGY